MILDVGSQLINDTCRQTRDKKKLLCPWFLKASRAFREGLWRSLSAAATVHPSGCTALLRTAVLELAQEERERENKTDCLILVRSLRDAFDSLVEFPHTRTLTHATVALFLRCSSSLSPCLPQSHSSSLCRIPGKDFTTYFSPQYMHFFSLFMHFFNCLIIRQCPSLSFF